jgi:aminopeptidase N
VKRITLVVTLLLGVSSLSAQAPQSFTHADTLRGSNGPGRSWWDAVFYDLHTTVFPADSTIKGWNGITYRVLTPGKEMQIDLQEPMIADSIKQDGKTLQWRRDGNAFFVTLSAAQPVGKLKTVTVWYHGKPRSARNPPWDGGLIWRQDSLRNGWIATADEGLGASVWWPNKDWGGDEPDSQRIAITVPKGMTDVSNGRLRSQKDNADGTTTFEWFVSNPINNYAIEINAGQYAHFADTLMGEKGKLTLDFWPLANHLDTARVQFQQAKSMITCFEHWFGPFPWYEDGYKLIEAPHLGMEHQSGVAYGNRYKNGYSGRDLSGTGIGMKWDFIIVHESGHEWFGNNISAKDHADMWIHEGFTNYSEGLYTECQQGKEAGARYIIGSRRNIRNDKPIIAAYGVNGDGSGDMYYKSGSMLHMMRQIVNDDEKWRVGVLRGLNKTFWHQTVTTPRVEAFIHQATGINFDKVFEQYLTTTMIPTIEFKIAGNVLSYHWANTVPGFDIPVRVSFDGGTTWSLVKPTEEYQNAPVRVTDPAAFKIDENWYVMSKNVSGN